MTRQAGELAGEESGKRENEIVRRKEPSVFARYARYAHVGVQFGLILLLGILGGSQLDKRLGTGSVLTLIGIFLGAGIGFYVLYREAQRATGDDPEDVDPRDDRARRGRGSSRRTPRGE